MYQQISQIINSVAMRQTLYLKLLWRKRYKQGNMHRYLVHLLLSRNYGMKKSILMLLILSSK